MAQEDVHLLDDDAGLALGLSLGGGGASDAARQGTGGSSRLSRSPRALEPSLTLSMPDEATATGSGGCVGGGGGPAHSVSSLSVAGVKRERVEEADGERASSTAAAARVCGAAAEDDDDGSTRKKLRLTKEQSALLEDRFKEHSTLNPVRTRSPRRARHDRLTDWSIVALPLHNTTMDR
jgi:homeobox-leucine zipper protein